MKTLSGRFWFVVFGIIVIVAVGSCCTFPFVTNTAPFFGVEIGNMQRDQYVKWKQPAFDTALKQVCDRHGTYCLKAKLDNGSIINQYHPEGSNCTSPNCSRENIRTVKVTKSKVADNTAAGQSAANDPNIMHRVQSPDPGDIKKVLDALEQ